MFKHNLKIVLVATLVLVILGILGAAFYVLDVNSEEPLWVSDPVWAEIERDFNRFTERCDEFNVSNLEEVLVQINDQWKVVCAGEQTASFLGHNMPETTIEISLYRSSDDRWIGSKIYRTNEGEVFSWRPHYALMGWRPLTPQNQERVH